MRDLLAPNRPAPSWLIEHSYEDRRLGVLKTGKEAEVFLVERTSPSGSCLLAHKRYRPRYPTAGELRELGFSKATHYRHDSVYRAGWNLNARDRRAVKGSTDWGRTLKGFMWPVNEMAMLELAWRSGASVPYPVERTEEGILMEFIGDLDQAAPRLVDARLEADGLADAFAQLVESLRALTSAGVVHADLSVYNLLWWRDRLVIIDFPQAVTVTENAEAIDLLHRDVDNVCTWFSRRGVVCDAGATFAELLALAF
ncbi:MAG: serine/threonine protein kinase [Chloroflexota bacterium]|nr:serine/threonine protein kinase [Chloroflexota bacterium]